VISLGGKGSPSPLISLLVRFRLVEDGGRNAGSRGGSNAAGEGKGGAGGAGERRGSVARGSVAQGSGGGVWRGGDDAELGYLSEILQGSFCKRCGHAH
jgi:hypothetical protein